MTSPAVAAHRVSVGIGQIAISKDPNDVLVSYGLGSCIGVSVFDSQNRIGGLVHVLLPGERTFYDLEGLWEAMPMAEDVLAEQEYSGEG